MFHYRFSLVALISILGLFSGRAYAAPETDFWKWFENNEKALFEFELDQERTFNRLAEAMHKVHPSLTFEFGPKDHGRREFVISADGIREAFPKVESLYTAAPKLARWKIVKFRPRRDPFDVTYNGVSVKASDVLVVLQPDEKKVALTVLVKGYTPSSHKSYLGVAFLILDQALGEYDVETRVGQIHVAAQNGALSEAITLKELPNAFDKFFSRH